MTPSEMSVLERPFCSFAQLGDLVARLRASSHLVDRVNMDEAAALGLDGQPPWKRTSHPPLPSERRIPPLR